MSLVDVAIVLFLFVAAAHGITQGAAIQVLSFGGFWAGLALGAVLSPAVSGLATSHFATAFLSLFTFFGVAVAGGVLGRYLGTHAWRGLQRLKLGPADSALGALVAAGAVLVAIWLFAVMLSVGPTRQLSNAIHRSAIVRWLEDRLPPAPAVFARVQALIDTTGFPRVFAGLEPTPTEPVETPSDPDVRAAQEAGFASTVKIVGLGCGGVQTGSGFVAGSGIVVTNAHVVAGIDSPTVEDRAGRHDAVVVLFDPDLDVAVLRTTGLAGDLLAILDGGADRGDGAAVLGFPGGGDFRARAAAVLRRFEAVGRDIYGRDLTRRDVYQLQAQVRQGNSGGPFVESTGRVLGVVFAASSNDDNVGYALTSEQVLPSVRAASERSAPVDTGPCVN